LPKLSFHQTAYSKVYPQALGSNFAENILKDYNGQTYWISIPIKRFISSSPKWICVSLGYGAEGMVDGLNNTPPGYVGQYPEERYRQWFFSMDIDLSEIKTKNITLKFLFKTLNIIKMPFPTLECSKGQIKGHIMYF